MVKGMVIGIATLVPGVSGGTMSIILGVYTDMLEGVSRFFSNWRRHALVLGELALGGLAGILLLSRLLAWLLEEYTLPMQYLFLGIIAGGLPLLVRQCVGGHILRLGELAFAGVGLALVLLMSGEPAALFANAEHTTPFVLPALFFGGLIIALAFVLPGISASFMLLTLGLYGLTVQAINTLNLTFLLPLGLGVVVGTVVAARLVKGCLERFPRQTFLLILGFVAGSLFTLAPGLPVADELWLSLACCVGGFAATYTLGRMSREG